MVKQTVMTSVYGVTYVGARKQIQARLKERFQERNGGRMLSKEEESDVYEASRYIATVRACCGPRGREGRATHIHACSPSH